MTSIADVDISGDGTGLGELFEAVPSLSCEMERVIASQGHGLWLSGASQERLETALTEADAVDAYTLITAEEDRWLYDVEFDPDTVDVFELVLEEDGTVMSATAANGSWQLSIRVVDRESVSTLYDRLVDHGVQPSIVRLYDLGGETHSECGLTDRQYETLVAAVDHGYFEIPREVSMQELSDELDISHQALSERLRRAYRALVTAELDVNEIETEEATAPPVPSD